MALNWSWSQKCGEATLETKGGKKYELSLYNGNAYLIFVREFEEDGVEKYEVFSFWVDKGHAKRCLGLENDTYNLYDGSESMSKITKFRFDKKKCRKANEIIGLIVKAFDEVEIELYKAD